MIYDSYKQCSAANGIPIKKLRLAKNDLGAPGFDHNRVNWEVFSQWHNIGANKIALDNLYTASTGGKKDDNRPIEEIKRSLLLKDEVLADLEIKKKSGDYLDPKEISDFLLKLRLSFEAVINGWCTELPVKFVGKSQGEIESILGNERSILLQSFANQIKEQCLKK